MSQNLNIQYERSILTTKNTQPVIRAIKENLYAFFKYLSRAIRSDFDIHPGLVTWQTKIPHPWFNAVLSTQPPGQDAQHTIEHTLKWFASRHVSAISWWLATEPEIQKWEEELLLKGFVKDSNTPGMAVSLDRLVNPPKLHEFEIRPVHDPATLQTWTDIFRRGYELPEEWTAGLGEMMTNLGLELPISNYLGYLNGEPVTASTRFLGAGVAGIYNVATIEPARGKGIGSLMTTAPLLEARQVGYHWGTLQSSQMGYGVYRRLGFEKLCDMEHFFREI